MIFLITNDLSFYQSYFCFRLDITRMVYVVKDLADFNAQLEAAGGKLVVVDFFATW